MNSGQFQRIYTLNDNFFDIIDSESKAYFLGLLYADGHNNTNKGIITIQLQSRDRDILDKFNKEIETDKPLLFIDRQVNSNQQNLYKLNIVSRHMSNRLSDLGCFYKKSLILKFPTKQQVPNSLIHHFIRGCFDGDGHISNSGASSIVSSKYFIESLKIELEKRKISSYIVNCKNPMTKRLIINKKQNALIFLSWIYEKSNFYIQRKYNKFFSIKETNNNIIRIVKEIRASKKSSKELSIIYKMSASNIRSIKNGNSRKNIQ